MADDNPPYDPPDDEKPKEEVQSPEFYPILRSDLLEGLFESSDIRLFRRDAATACYRIALAHWNAICSINEVIAGWNSEAAAELKRELTADDVGFLYSDLAWLKERIAYYRSRLKLPKTKKPTNGDSDSAPTT